MIIEFIGTPGCGKTTLMPAVIEYLRDRNMRGYSVVQAARPFAGRTLLGRVINRLAPTVLRDRLLWQVFYHSSTLHQLKFGARHLRLMWQVIKSQRHRPLAADARQRRVLHWFFRLIGSYEFLTTLLGNGEVLVLDEGFLHRVVQMYASDVEEPDLAQIVAYVNLLPRPDWVIFPNAAWEICERRIYRRGLWERFRHKSPAQISRYVANAHRVVTLTVDYIKNKGWTVIEVDNGSDDLNASSAELRKGLALVVSKVRNPDIRDRDFSPEPLELTTQ